MAVLSILSSILLCTYLETQSATTAAPAFRRVALVIGANSGGEGRPKLKYAASDARSFASVLVELGGVQREDLSLLIDPSLSDVRSAANRLRESVERFSTSGQRCEMFFYYSGHSDESGLLLGKERLPYDVLRADIEKVPAAVRVAILDSCSSGAITRTKGGTAKPAFLFDASNDMKGHMYITSSSADEAAQESDRIGASFFTHYLISALRGAADTAGTGRVTLNDAYAFAFRETLASTENTQYGPQHPAYEINLTGSGDLIFTDLRSTTAGLALAEDVAGRVYVRDARGALVVELNKNFGKRMELGLPPGAYTLSYMDRDLRFEAQALVPAGGRCTVYSGDFKRSSTSPAVARGPDSENATEPQAAETAYHVAPTPESRPQDDQPPSATNTPFLTFSSIILPDFTEGIFYSADDKVVGINAFFGMTHDLRGFEVASLLNAASGNVFGVQFAGIANASRLRLGGLQLSGIANVAIEGGGGAQIASALSLARGDFYGVQLASANVGTGHFIGVQAGLVNFAKTIGGPQLGLVNVFEEGVGAQVGLVNTCYEIRGVQIGLVNVARRIDGVAIGLFSFERDGILDAEAWWCSDSTVSAAFMAGTRYTYTIASLDWDTSGGEAPLSLGLGLGGRIPIAKNYIDLDLSWRFMEVGSALFYSLPRFRVVAGLRAKGPGMIIGGALDLFMPGLSRDGHGEFVSNFKIEPRLIVGIHL
jgi:hypothetical protein